MSDIEHLINEVRPLIETTASEYGRRFWKYGIDREDFAQELYLWCLQHGHKLTEWLAEEGGEKALSRALRNEAKDIGREWKATSLGYSTGDEYFYSRGEVKALLASMFSPEAWLEPPVSEGRSTKAPAHGGNWIATLADVSQAFARLNISDRELLTLFHKDDYSNKLAAEVYSISEAAMSSRHNTAINRLSKLLGGEKPRRNGHDDDCPTPLSGCWKGRRATSNATARARTDGQYDE